MKVKKKIFLVQGVGSAPTEIDAFDNVLLECGIGNFNLIRLSSVLPPNSRVVVENSLKEKYGEWGDRLYVVYAFGATKRVGDQIWAGIGWVVLEENGAGLFIEHDAPSKEVCERLIKESLVEMCRARGLDLEDYEHDLRVIGATCTDENRVVTALVAAVYEAEGWR